jgi:hypothetical protein
MSEDGLPTTAKVNTKLSHGFGCGMDWMSTNIYFVKSEWEFRKMKDIIGKVLQLIEKLYLQLQFNL